MNAANVAMSATSVLGLRRLPDTLVDCADGADWADGADGDDAATASVTCSAAAARSFPCAAEEGSAEEGVEVAGGSVFTLILVTVVRELILHAD